MTATRIDAGEGEGGGQKKRPRPLQQEDGEPLSPPARLFREPKFNCHILAVMGIGKRIDVGVVRAGLEETLLRHPRFSSIQVFDADGGARWIHAQVNLANHLIIPELNAGAILDPDLFVEDYVSSLSVAPALGSSETAKPLWELHLLNLPTSEAEATAVFRIHHSLGDGSSLMSLLLACTRKTSDPAALPTIPGGSGKNTVVTGGSRKTVWLSAWFAAVVSVLWVVWNTVADVALFLATTAGLVKDTETPIKGKSGTEFNRKRVVHRAVPLEDLKTVKRATNATINDVLLGIFSAGLTRYLARRYGSSGIPARTRVRAALLVNLRKTSEIRALADGMAGCNNPIRWGNKLGYVLLPFPIIKCSNPLDYVKAGKAIANRKKSSMEAHFAYFIAALLLKLLGGKVAIAVGHRLMSNVTLSFSNVVGPTEEIGFYGHPVVYLAPTVYGHPHALTIHFQSYRGKMMMVLAADETVIPDPHQLCDDLVESLDVIKSAAELQGSS